MPIARLICGLRTAEEITFAVSRPPGVPALDLLITTSEPAKDAVSAYGNGAWPHATAA
jgi:hypothetical protein